jgi:site-specific recombinase XerD
LRFHLKGNRYKTKGIHFAAAIAEYARAASIESGPLFRPRRSPHSEELATLFLDAREPIESVQDLLDHKHITTTQIYDKRRRSVKDSASHKVPI